MIEQVILNFCAERTTSTSYFGNFGHLCIYGSDHINIIYINGLSNKHVSIEFIELDLDDPDFFSNLGKTIDKINNDYN